MNHYCSGNKESEINYNLHADIVVSNVTSLVYIYTHYMYVSRYIPQESSGSAGHPKLKVDAVGKAEEGEHNLADG